MDKRKVNDKVKDKNKDKNKDIVKKNEKIDKYMLYTKNVSFFSFFYVIIMFYIML